MIDYEPLDFEKEPPQDPAGQVLALLGDPANHAIIIEILVAATPPTTAQVTSTLRARHGPYLDLEPHINALIEADVVSLDVVTDQLTVTRPEPLITIIREAHRLAAATTAQTARESQAALEELEARLAAALGAAEQDR